MRHFAVAMAALIGSVVLFPGAASSQTVAPTDLKALYQADQVERTQIQKLTSRAALIPAAKEMAAHDAQRRAQVLALIQAQALHTSEDYRMAAMIFQHGLKAEDYALAHALATIGSVLAPDDQNLRWLVAASTDRWLLSRQKQQWYGTQPLCVIDSKTGKPPTCKLDVVDGAVSDAERAAAGLSPLAQLRAETAAKEQALRSGPLHL